MGPDAIATTSDPRWAHAIAHPLRTRLLAALNEQEASPVALAAQLGEPIGNVSYHVRKLYDLGLLDLVRTRPRRGATEHFYKGRGYPEDGAPVPASSSPEGRRDLLNSVGVLYDHALRSAAAGGFDGRDAHASRTPLKLDAQGRREVAAAAREWVSAARRIERDALARTAISGEIAVSVGLALLAFAATALSAELPDGAEVAPVRARTGRTL